MTTTGVNVEQLSKYTKEYIRKTDDFNKIEKVEEVLSELAKENNKVNSAAKTTIQKVIKLYKTQRDFLQKMKMNPLKSGNIDLELLNKYSDKYIQATNISTTC